MAAEIDRLVARPQQRAAAAAWRTLTEQSESEESESEESESEPEKSEPEKAES